MSINKKSFATAMATRIESDRMDSMLDEALGETFPASDPVAITPVRHEVDGKSTIAPDAASEMPGEAAATRDTRQHRGQVGDHR